MDFLFRDSLSQVTVSPTGVGVPNRRREHPTPGCSTLITSAPNSPRIEAA